MAIAFMFILTGCTTAPESGPPSQSLSGAVFKDCVNCPQMVVIEPGSFQMGSEIGEIGRTYYESPVHRVDITRSFAIGIYEVTFDEWDACVAGGGCAGYHPDDEGWGRGRRPVINVNWNAAKNYALWLSRKTGHAYHLPSEAQWEYAARARSTGPFYFSEISPEKANYNAQVGYNGSPTGKYSVGTKLVGSYPPNSFGLFDTLGNVAEWVADCFHLYVAVPKNEDPLIRDNCSSHIQRGGGWDDFPQSIRLAGRFGSFTPYSSNALGFRIAREVEE